MALQYTEAVSCQKDITESYGNASVSTLWQIEK